MTNRMTHAVTHLLEHALGGLRGLALGGVLAQLRVAVGLGALQQSLLGSGEVGLLACSRSEGWVGLREGRVRGEARIQD